MTTPIRSSNVSSQPTTDSALPESARRRLAVVPESRGTSVLMLEPISPTAAMPADFLDIDELVADEEVDPVSRESIAAGRKAVAESYYADTPRSLTFYRLHNGWSQKELATRMHTSQSYIARLEAGDIDLQVSTLKRLANVFDVQPAVLLEAIISKAVRK